MYSISGTAHAGLTSDRMPVAFLCALAERSATTSRSLVPYASGSLVGMGSIGATGVHRSFPVRLFCLRLR